MTLTRKSYSLAQVDNFLIPDNLKTLKSLQVMPFGLMRKSVSLSVSQSLQEFALYFCENRVRSIPVSSKVN